MELIDTTLPSNAFIDFCRYLVGVLGVVVFLFALVRFLSHRLFWSAVAFMGVGLLTAFQEAEALGEPLIPWRLPLLALANVAAAIFLYRGDDVGRA